MRSIILPAVAATLLFGQTAVANPILYVSNYNVDTLSTVSSDGVVQPFVGGVVLPGQIAIDAKGNLYVGNGITANTVTKVTPDGTTSIFASGINGTGGIVLDPAGFFYVSAAYSGEIYKLSMSGVLTPFASLPSGASPQYLALDQYGNLYTSDAYYGGARYSGTIDRITPDGTVSTFVTGIGQPEGIAFDSKGYLYVASLTDNTILKISPDGSNVSVFASGLDSPTPIVFDSQGNLFVGGQTIYEINPSGEVSDFVKSGGYYLEGANGLAFAPQGVPEPSSLILLSMALVVLLGFLGLRDRQCRDVLSRVGATLSAVFDHPNDVRRRRPQFLNPAAVDALLQREVPGVTRSSEATSPDCSVKSGE